MSLTTRFRFNDVFPFCVPTSGSTYTVDNLTLAQVMDVAWNVEQIQIAATGSLTEVAAPNRVLSAGTTITLNPFSVTSPFDSGAGDSGMVFPPGYSGSFAGFPAIFEPYQRVCANPAAPGFVLVVTAFVASESPSFVNNAELAILVDNDSVNVGKYRLQFTVIINRVYNPAVLSMSLRFTTDSSSGGTPVGSGTFTLFGFTVPWYAFSFGVASSASGIGMTASSSLFTYPP